ncbi:MAG: lipoyl(octanoyl) transferase LipB [Propionibacteriaceae bacterium]|jgi:lipoyl(octanoyl) transferase|nr:lipoyl(octanoyl) transferase LipB [Propionibacteriaceae bacterium]
MIRFHYFGIEGAPAPWQSIWEKQLQLHALVASGQLGPQVIFAEHSSIYTAGRATQPAELPRDGSPVVQVNRGGRITWHGPGQLACYPIVKLTIGSVDYLRLLEQVIHRCLADWGITSVSPPTLTGAWVPATSRRPLRKIAFIGARVAQHTSLHGFALNVSNTLAPFANIIPCGLEGVEVTSMAAELPYPPSVLRVAHTFERHLEDVFC